MLNVKLLLMLLLVATLKADLCDKCLCEFEEITPFIDCSTKDMTDIEWSLDVNPLQDKIVDIDFEDNALSKVSKLPADLPIQRLSFRQNQITTIEFAAFENLPYLSYLDLSYNSIENLTEEMFKGPSRNGAQPNPSPLLSLDLSYNQIAKIPKTAFLYLIHLEEINLSGNPLQILHSHFTSMAIGSLNTLVTLNLSHTGIEDLPRNFLKGLHEVRKLDVSKNNCEFVPAEIQYHGTDINELVLDGNPIQKLKSHSFSSMGNLQKLSLSQMPLLHEIKASAFTGLLNLKTLKIANNPRLAYVDPDAFMDFQHPMVLKKVDFSNNYLRYMPKDLLVHLGKNSSLQSFAVEGNVWECDCHNQWLIDLMNTLEFRSFGIEAECSKPFNLQGLNFVEAKGKELPCENEEQFDARKKDFGLPHPQPPGLHNESQMLAVVITLACIITIIGAAIFVGVLYLQKQQRISYARVSAFKIHFSRRTPTSENSSIPSSSNLGNVIYRDNPTTIPLE